MAETVRHGKVKCTDHLAIAPTATVKEFVGVAVSTVAFKKRCDQYRYHHQNHRHSPNLPRMSQDCSNPLPDRSFSQVGPFSYSQPPSP